MSQLLQCVMVAWMMRRMLIDDSEGLLHSSLALHCRHQPRCLHRRGQLRGWIRQQSMCKMPPAHVQQDASVASSAHVQQDASKTPLPAAASMPAPLGLAACMPATTTIKGSICGKRQGFVHDLRQAQRCQQVAHAIAPCLRRAGDRRAGDQGHTLGHRLLFRTSRDHLHGAARPHTLSPRASSVSVQKGEGECEGPRQCCRHSRKGGSSTTRSSLFSWPPCPYLAYHSTSLSPSLSLSSASLSLPSLYVVSLMAHASQVGSFCLSLSLSSESLSPLSHL